MRKLARFKKYTIFTKIFIRKIFILKCSKSNSIVKTMCKNVKTRMYMQRQKEMVW